MRDPQEPALQATVPTLPVNDLASDASALQRYVIARTAERTRQYSGLPLRAVFALSGVFALLPLSACTTEQMYGSGQAWQRNQCSRMPDKADADHCAAGAGMPYESYKRQSELEPK